MYTLEHSRIWFRAGLNLNGDTQTKAKGGPERDTAFHTLPMAEMGWCNCAVRNIYLLLKASLMYKL